MVVSSGSFLSAFFKTHKSHLFASKVLVDLLVHSPSSVGAASNGTLCIESKGLLASLATLAIRWPRVCCRHPRLEQQGAWIALVSEPVSLFCGCEFYTPGSLLSSHLSL